MPERKRDPVPGKRATPKSRGPRFPSIETTGFRCECADTILFADQSRQLEITSTSAVNRPATSPSDGSTIDDVDNCENCVKFKCSKKLTQISCYFVLC